jgi:hypothetical protein
MGVRVTTPARTILDLAPRLNDTRLSRAVNDLLHSRFLQPNTFAEFVQGARGRPGVVRLRPFVARAYSPTRSEFEDAFLVFAERYGLPEPEINRDVAGYEADVRYPAQKLIIELDSWEYHKDRRSFESNRDRDADLLDRTGDVTVRLTWERMTGKPASEAARLKRIIASRTPARDRTDDAAKS